MTHGTRGGASGGSSGSPARRPGRDTRTRGVTSGAAAATSLPLLDDLFLARRISDASAELLRTILHRRYKLHLSIILTSNRLVQDWGKYLGDNTMGSTILERLMHRSTKLDFEGQSCRLKEATARFARDTSNDS
jgi:hypothetical protein